MKKVIIFSSLSQTKLEEDVAHFINRKNLEIIDVQYSTNIREYSVMIIYKRLGKTL